MPRYTLGRRIVWVSLPKSPFILTSFCPTPTGNKNGRKCRLNVSCRTLGQRKCATVLPKRAALHPRATKMGVGVAQACRAVLSGDEKARKCCLKVSCCTLGRRKCSEVSPKRAVLYSRATKSVGFVAEESLHPYVILPCTFRQRKWAEVSPESVVLHPRATKMRDSVAQACRAALSGDEKCGFRCRGVPFILTSFCLAPFGNENGLKCRLNVSCRTFGRRRSAEVSLKRAALHPRATNSVGFVAEESNSSLRHSVLHPRATKMDGSVA